MINQTVEKAYRIGIFIKGIDGMLEVLIGALLFMTPATVHTLFTHIIGSAEHHRGHTYALIAEYIGRLDADMAKSGATFLAVFLLGHGVVKLVLVYCLTRRMTWVYPYALFVLIGFLLYQMYVLISHPTLTMLLFSVLDAAIIYFVWLEYRSLRKSRQ